MGSGPSTPVKIRRGVVLFLTTTRFGLVKVFWVVDFHNQGLFCEKLGLRP